MLVATLSRFKLQGLVDWDSLMPIGNTVKPCYISQKTTLEIEADDGKFGENRVLLVHLNADTVVRDANFIKHVIFSAPKLLN